ncbi:hypothetical protein Y695_00187 [Hydrogenophaga sp. T4]|jgi:DNA-binding IclR family transcriptional regulator|nr:hypothetical protein Y695_00187 [Hydrogenophaga sp. T4]
MNTPMESTASFAARLQAAIMSTVAAYLKRLQAEGLLRPLRHPGNFVLTFQQAGGSRA